MRRHCVDILPGLLVCGVLCFLFILNVRPANSQPLAAWSQEFGAPGINGRVSAIELSPDQNRIYIVGNFISVSSKVAKGIAYRENGAWHALPEIPEGIDREIRDVQIDLEGSVYVISYLDLSGGISPSIMKWDGASWRSLGGFFNNTPSTFSVVSPDEIYTASCDINSAGFFGDGISRWHEDAWRSLGTQACVGVIHTHSDGSVFSVGNSGGFSPTFVEIFKDGIFVQRIDREVSRLVSGNNNELYAAYRDPQSTLYFIGQWDGSDWIPLPNSEGFTPRQMRVDEAGNLLILNYSGNDPVLSVEKWDGQDWTTVFTDGPVRKIFGDIEDFLPADDGFYVAGEFNSETDVNLKNLVFVRDDQLMPVASGGGLDGSVADIEVSGSNIFIGGRFDQAGGIGANNVVRRERGNWRAMGEGLLGGVSDLEVASDGVVYAGGSFRLSELDRMSAISKWDGATWSSLGDGLQANGFPEGFLRVNAIEEDQQGNLYVGGEFDEAAGQPSPRLAKWTSERWVPMTLPYPITSNVSVESFKVCHENDLYVGIIRRDAKGQIVPFLKWDGSDWSVIGEVRRPSGDYTAISAIECTEQGVYIGGVFDEVSGVGTRNVAYWDGQDWLSLKGGVNAGVNALAMNAEGNLVVAGSFRWAHQTSTVNLAIWNGSDWLPFGKGTEMDTDEVNATISTLTSVSIDSMFIGGRFQQIDSFNSSGIALYDFTKEDVTEPDPAPLPDLDVAVVYPNPNSDEIGHFQFVADEISEVSIYLYDGLGQQLNLLFQGDVFPDVTTEIEFSVSRLAAGTYYIRLLGQDTRITTPFVVTH